MAVQANYIIFHPDSARDLVSVKATVSVQGMIFKNWTGRICVDAVFVGNEDPFVFNNPWIYSYCHASQLRRHPRSDSYIQLGSTLIFVSGQSAENDHLSIDTFFVVGGIENWSRLPLQLPTKYSSHFQNNRSDLWNRHFYTPFDIKQPSHTGVTHTFEAKLWTPDEVDFSFLPLTKEEKKLSISFSMIPDAILSKIKNNIRGKYPVLLSTEEMESIKAIILRETYTQVLKDIKLITTLTHNRTNCTLPSMKVTKAVEIQK